MANYEMIKVIAVIQCLNFLAISTKSAWKTLLGKKENKIKSGLHF